jgi:hypothetical protein
MAIFLDESFVKSAVVNEDAKYLMQESAALKIDADKYARQFGHDAGGMEICFESEVAWNELMHEMQVAEFQSLQEGIKEVAGKIWEKIKEWAKAIKNFFLRIWNAIKAWVTKAWQKLTGTHVPTIVEQLKKYAKYASKVQEVELYELSDVNDLKTAGENASKTVAGMIDALNKAADSYNAATSAKGTSEAADAEIEKLKKEKNSADAKIDAVVKELDKTLSEEKQKAKKVKVNPGLVSSKLQDTLKMAEAFKKFVESEDKLIAKGTKGAEDLYKAAEQAATKKDADKAATEAALALRQRGLAAARAIVQKQIRIGQFMYTAAKDNQSNLISAAKAVIKEGKANAK